MITAPENSNELITSLVLIDRGTIRPTLSALKTVLDGGDITLYHDVNYPPMLRAFTIHTVIANCVDQAAQDWFKKRKQ